jgi:hypothetical protein
MYPKKDKKYIRQYKKILIQKPNSYKNKKMRKKRKEWTKHDILNSKGQRL